MASPVASGSENKSHQLRSVIVLSTIALVIGLIVGHMVTYHAMEAHHRSPFLTPYQAILLTNGAVYYGKLSGYGSRNPVLEDVFYIVSKTDPQTKEVTNVLVKRGKELHGPDRMYLNSSQIVFIEPVGPDSKVAQLIQQAHQ